MTSTHYDYCDMVFRHYFTFMSTVAHFTSASPTRVSGQITWSVADGRQMEPFARNWLMVSQHHEGFCSYVVITTEWLLFLTTKLWCNLSDLMYNLLILSVHTKKIKWIERECFHMGSVLSISSLFEYEWASSDLMFGESPICRHCLYEAGAVLMT